MGTTVNTENTTKATTENYVAQQISQASNVVTSAETLYNNAMVQLLATLNNISKIADISYPVATIAALRDISFTASTPKWTKTDGDINISTNLSQYIPVPKIVGVSLPNAPNDIIPVTDIPFIEELYYSALIEKFKSALTSGLSGGTGIPNAYEEAIYDRDKVRREKESDRLIAEVSTAFAARGFSRPTGAYSAAVNQVTRDKVIALADSSRDAMTTRIELEQKYIAMLYQAIPQIESILVDYHDKMQNRKVAVAKGGIDGSIEVWKNTLQRYTTLMEAARIESDVSIAQITAVTETNKGIASQNSLVIEEAKAKAEVSVAKINADVQMFQAEVDGFKAEIDAFVAKSDGKIKAYTAEAQAEIANVEASIKAADAAVQAMIGTNSILADVSKANASVSAQVLASALNSINTAISYGYSGSFTSNYSHDQTKIDPSGAQTINYHYFDQTSAT